MNNLRKCQSCITCCSCLINDAYDGFDYYHEAEYFCETQDEEHRVSIDKVCDDWEANDAQS
jgi:hypothetical protein